MDNLTLHQLDYLCEALRRDMRSEEQKVAAEPQFAFEHGYNARKNKELLETLIPKRNSAY